MRTAKANRTARQHPAIWVLLACSLVLAGCGGGGAASVSAPPAPPSPAANPSPSVGSLAPTNALVGGSSFTLTVNGTGFVAASAVQWNGTSLTTNFVSNSQLTANVPTSALATPGTAAVTVTNPAPGGGTSAASNFAIDNPAPAIGSVSPASALAGAGGFTLIVNGSGFVSGTTIQWNGAAVSTTFVSSTQVTASVPASALATAGTATVIVGNPTPGGGTSPATSFAIDNPGPVVSALLPASVIAGSAGFTMTINGLGFVSGSTVRWNGSNLATTMISSTELSVAISAADVASAGTAQIEILNPAPGGGLSTAVTFTVANGLAALSALNPSATPAGSSGFILSVTGSGFVNGSTVEWNGQPLTTLFISGAQLDALVTASQISTTGTASVQVTNPAPGGGLSNALAFTIQNGIPVLGTAAPNRASAGGTSFTLTVNGQYFVPGAAVQWNGMTLTTSFVNDTLLTADVPASGIAAAGSAQVSVWNPGPGGGTSNRTAFTIDPVLPRFAYIAQPVEGLIQTMVIDSATGEMRYAGYEAALAPFTGPWDLRLDRSQRFLFALDDGGQQVHVFHVDPQNGRLTLAAGSPFATGGSGPYSLASHPSGRFIYVANSDSNTISAFQVDPATGSLTAVPGSPYSTGSYPIWATAELTGKFLYVSGYYSNDIWAYSINSATGELTSVPGSPFPNTGDGAWCLAADPQGRFLHVVNGNEPTISSYRIDGATGALAPTAPGPLTIGAFLQVMTTDSSGRFAYVPDSNGGGPGTIHVLSIDPVSGNLSPVAAVPTGDYPWSVNLDTAASLALVPNFNSWEVDVFQVDSGTGALTSLHKIATRQNPSHIALLEGTTQAVATPTFAYVSGAAGNTIERYAIDPNSGDLALADSTTTAASSSAMSMDAKGRFLFAASPVSNSISAFAIDSASGSLSAAPGATAPVAATAQSLAGEASGRFIFAAGGTSGEVNVFSVDQITGALAPAGSATMSSNPAHLAVDSTGRYLLVSDPTDNMLATYAIDLANGSLTRIGSHTLPGAGYGALAADPMLRYFCAASPGTAGVHCFVLQAPTGAFWPLQNLSTGPNPSALATDPAGRFLYVADSTANAVFAYAYDPMNSVFTPVGIFPAGTAPSVVNVDSSGRFVYVWNAGSQDVTIFRLDPVTGSLSITNTAVFGDVPRAAVTQGSIR